MEQKKFLETYEAPVVEIVEVNVEGILCASGGTEDWEWVE